MTKYYEQTGKTPSPRDNKEMVNIVLSETSSDNPLDWEGQDFQNAYLLEFLGDNPSTLKEISKETLIPKKVLSKMVDVLVKKGYVKIVNNRLYREY